MRLALDRVSFAYPGGRPVLSNTSLSIPAGQAVAVMAPSGFGKSTLLGLAGLLLRPTGGSVLIDGVPRAAGDTRGGGIAWVLQTVSLLPRRTVLDNVALPALASGSTRRAAYEQAEGALHHLGLHHDLNGRQARTLSGGQAQRVGVARALIGSPSILLADEPTANLDAATALDVARSLVRSVARTGCAAVLATHDPHVAALADRVLVIRDCRLQEDR